MKLPPDTRRLVVARLRAGAHDGLLSQRVRQAAGSVGISERTLWRWLQAEPPNPKEPSRYELTVGDLDEYSAHRGNAAAVWRARHAKGDGPALRTLQRAFDRELRPGDRAAVVEGAEGRRRHQVYLRWEARYRNEIWEADHKELEILVLAPRCQRPQKPWVTLFLDAFSRLRMDRVGHLQRDPRGPS